MIRLLFFIIIGLFLMNHAHAQIYLQLERAGTVKVRKYASGEYITFKSTEHPEYWQHGPIYKILPEEKSVVFADRITYLRDISHFRYKRSWPQAIGNNLMVFGISWFGFAGLIELTSELDLIDSPYRFGTDTAIIGGTALVTGFLTKRLFTTVTKKINKRNRLRIIDLRM